MADSGQAPLSPPATATAVLAGKTISVKYSAPSLRGRHLGGSEIVPYGQVWRTGANSATTITLPMDVTLGTLKVPAGTYTLFTLPTASDWTLIVSKKTGEWGIPYPEGSDLGRTPMTKTNLSAPQEIMSISFEKTAGTTTEMHIKWETTDAWVPVKAM
ncbi:MAG: DUF2911 domain-containing protein [Acidobacteriota bacterium]|nr:DUF2911 domain-containing protein [Acidobacteriota bacterium]